MWETWRSNNFQTKVCDLPAFLLNKISGNKPQLIKRFQTRNQDEGHVGAICTLLDNSNFKLLQNKTFKNKKLQMLSAHEDFVSGWRCGLPHKVIALNLTSYFKLTIVIIYSYGKRYTRQAWCHIPVIPVLWESERGRSQIQAMSGQLAT